MGPPAPESTSRQSRQLRIKIQSKRKADQNRGNSFKFANFRCILKFLIRYYLAFVTSLRHGY